MKKIALFSILLIMWGSLPVIAAKKPVMEVHPTEVAVKIQNFPVTEPAKLAIQLRYANEKIKYFAFRNESDKLLKITVFEAAHELKPNEELSVAVPDVKNIVAEVSIYDPQVKNTVKHIPNSKVYLFRKQADGLFVLYSTY